MALGFAHLRKGDLSQAIAMLERSSELERTWTLPFFFPWIASTLGAAHALAGRLEAGLRLVEEAVERQRSMGLVADHL
jgi:hypothetical protein